MDDQVEIPIITTADTTGAKQTAAALQEVQKATTKHGEAAQEAGKQGEFLAQSHGEIRKELRELSREFPLAAQAARAFMNPLTAAVTIGIGLFAKWKQAIDEWNAKMDEASAKAANPDFAAGIQRQREAMQAGSVAMAGFEESLRQVATAQDSVIGKLTQTIDKLHDEAAAQLEINNAAEAKETADINRDESLGKLTPSAAILARAGVRQKYLSLGEQLKTQQENAEVEAKTNALYAGQEAQGGLEAEAAVKLNAANKLRGQVSKAKADLPTAQSNLKAANDEIAKLIEQYQKYEDSIAETYTIYDAKGHKQEFKGPNPAARNVLEEKQKAIDEARQRRNTYNREVKRLTAFANQGDIALVKMDKEATVAQTAATSNLEGINTLQDQIGPLGDANNLRQTSRGIGNVFKSRTIDDETLQQLAGTDIGKMLAQGSQTAHILLAGRTAQTAKDQGRPIAGGDAMIKAAQGITDSQKDLANMLAQNFKTGTQTLEQALRTVEASTSTLETFKQRFADLERKIHNVDRKQKFIGIN